jgi:NAD(P)-dependent dehydrogenase (short-subunit alcohol dehydrogenase family)
MPKTLLITGASTGFGRDMAETLAKAGHRVFASMRDPSGKNRERANALWSQGIDVVALDVTDDDSVGRAIQVVLGKAAKIDVLVNNAGIASAGITEAFTPAQFQAVLDTNVVGLLRTARAVLPGMRRAGEGLVVNVGSTMGRVTYPFFGLYGASKFAVEAFTDSLRCEVSPFGVDVVLIQPGGFYPTSIRTNTQMPADKDCETSYGAIARLPGDILRHFSSSVRGEGAPSLRDVTLAVAKLIDTPAGARPARSIVGHPNGADEVNQAVEPVQRRLMEDLGLGYLAKIGDQSAQRAP